MDAGGGGGSVKADINVTPLVDIVLVLLIIFIVITPAVSNAVTLPLAKHAVKQEKEVGAKYLALMLPAARDPQSGKVLGPGRVMVDDPNAKDDFGNPLTFAFDNEANKTALVGFITDSTRKLQDKRVFIKADAQLQFKHVNTLMQLCREGGADEASIVTSEDKSGEKKEEGGK